MKNYMPLRCHKDRQHNLYLSNYCAHAAKRWLERWVKRYENIVPVEALNDLMHAIKQFKILEDLERRD